MTVKELIETLSKCDPERVVVMSKDGEGNNFSPLADYSEGAYVPECTWAGQVMLEKLTAADRKAGYSEEDVAVNGQPCVCLWPTN